MSKAAPGRRRAVDASTSDADSDASSPQRRRASKTRGRQLRFSPAVGGLIALAIAISGAVFANNAVLPEQFNTVATDYVDGTQYGTTNAEDVTRSISDRDVATQNATQAKQKEIALAAYNASTSQQAAERSKEVGNQWVLPTTGYVLTARFGQRGYHWSAGYHTGLDFAGPVGRPLVAVTSGTIKSAGYDGPYGNRTVLHLDDGTDIWYCHQSKIAVKVGQRVLPGDLIGYMGATGNVTGPHLHMEVHPDGTEKNPVDPYTVLVKHGVRP